MKGAHRRHVLDDRDHDFFAKSAVSSNFEAGSVTNIEDVDDSSTICRAFSDTRSYGQRSISSVRFE